MIKVVIFDFFGVICSEVATSWMKQYYPDDTIKGLKPIHFNPVDLGKISESEFAKILGRLAGKNPIEAKAEWDSFVKISDEVVDVIKKLKNDYKIGLCSNAAGWFLRPILEKNDLVGLFDSIIISSDHKIIKPNPEIYKLSLKELAASPKEALLIDDSETNIAAAKKLGIYAILFKDAESLITDLKDLKVLI